MDTQGGSQGAAAAGSTGAGAGADVAGDASPGSVVEGGRSQATAVAARSRTQRSERLISEAFGSTGWRTVPSSAPTARASPSAECRSAHCIVLRAWLEETRVSARNLVKSRLASRVQWAGAMSDVDPTTQPMKSALIPLMWLLVPFVLALVYGFAS